MTTVSASQLSQINYFKELKKAHKSKRNFADLIGDLLGIKLSAAYARIRGEQFISYHDMEILNAYFKVPIKDKYFSLKNPRVGFEVTAFGIKYPLYSWMSDLLKLFETYSKDPDAHIYYMGSNLHLFYNFSTPNLAAFYIFWLHKFCLSSPTYKSQKFSIKNALKQPEVPIATKLWKKYQEISSTEIWTRYILITTIDKIKEMRRDKFFESEKDYQVLLQDIFKVMEDLDDQAEVGRKKDYPDAVYNLYSLELKHESNMAIVKAHGSLHLFNLLNNRTILMSMDEDFCGAQLHDFTSKLKNSKPLSTGNRQERHRIMNEYKEEMAKLSR